MLFETDTHGYRGSVKKNPVLKRLLMIPIKQNTFSFKDNNKKPDVLTR